MHKNAQEKSEKMYKKSLKSGNPTLQQLLRIGRRAGTSRQTRFQHLKNEALETFWSLKQHEIPKMST